MCDSNRQLNGFIVQTITKAIPKPTTSSVPHPRPDAGIEPPVGALVPVATAGGGLRPGKLASPGSLGPDVN
jgi:hypothetical protein